MISECVKTNQVVDICSRGKNKMNTALTHLPYLHVALLPVASELFLNSGLNKGFPRSLVKIRYWEELAHIQTTSARISKQCHFHEVILAQFSLDNYVINKD